MSTTEHHIKAILANELFIERKPEEISDTESLRNSLGLDSIGFIELRLQVEQMFSTTISDEDFTPETFATVESLARFIDGHRHAAAPADRTPADTPATGPRVE